MVINSRPLSYVSAEEPLTPFHLIVGRRLMNYPDHLCSRPDGVYEVSPELLTRRVQHFNGVLEKFWKRWREEYLLGLRELHQHSEGNSKADRISVGDIVIIADDQPRALWKLGRVEKTLIGPDGEPRGALLRVARKGRNLLHIRRPVQRLYPLEMARDRVTQSEENVPDVPGDFLRCSR